MSKLPVRETKKGLSPRTEATLSVIQALFPILAGIATAVWAVNGYLDQQKSSTTAQLIEARKPFLTKQFDTYIGVSEMVGVLASANPSSPEWKKAKGGFDANYWSIMSIVEDGGVEAAMVELNEILSFYKVGAPTVKSELQRRAFCLAHKMRDSIESNGLIKPQSEKDAPTLLSYFTKQSYFQQTTRDNCAARHNADLQELRNAEIMAAASAEFDKGSSLTK